MAGIFSVFNSSPDIGIKDKPETSSRVAGITTASAREPFLDFPLVPDTKLVSMPVPRNTLRAPEISARAALVRDASSGVTLLEKNAEEKLPIASLTKLMTALVVVENLSLDDEVEIKNSDLAAVPYRINIPAGEKVTVRGLLTAMLVSSANDAALALSRAVFGNTPDFVEAMNARARELRMTSTSFSNPVGFDSANHYSTASDLARLVEEFMDHTELLDIVKMKSAVVTSVSGRQKVKIYTTNKLMAERGDVIGLKTGFTAEAKGSLIILVNQKHDSSPETAYYSIILGSDDREDETTMLMKWVEENFIWK